MALDVGEKTDGVATDTVLNRRRAGRRADVSPELIPLLRTTGDGFLLPEDLEDADPLSASRGIGWALLIAVIVWALGGLVAWVFWGS